MRNLGDHDAQRAVPTWAVLAVCCIAQFMVVLDVSILNVALRSPNLSRVATR